MPGGQIMFCAYHILLNVWLYVGTVQSTDQLDVSAKHLLWQKKGRNYFHELNLRP